MRERREREADSEKKGARFVSPPTVSTRGFSASLRPVDL